MTEATLHPETTFSPAPGVVVREIDDELVLLHLGRSFYFGLDPVGARMWGVLTAGRTITEAFEVLVAEFEVEPERLRADLDKLVAELAEHGLIAASLSVESDRSSPDDARS